MNPRLQEFGVQTLLLDLQLDYETIFMHKKEAKTQKFVSKPEFGHTSSRTEQAEVL